MDPATEQFLQSAQALNDETSTLMFRAVIYWWFGGVFCAWCFCGLSTIVRIVRAGRAGGNVDI